MGARQTCLWLLLVLCGCGDPRLGGVFAGFTLDEASVDFGRAIAGTVERRSVVLRATGRGEVTVQVSVPAPFGAPAEVIVPGAGSVELPLSVRVPVGVAEAPLTLKGATFELQVALRVEGVEEKPCAPSGPCRASVFNLDAADCIETVLADGDPCQPLNQCLESGRCEQGECLGSPRTCDDLNPCTADACSATGGCLHSPVLCPPSTRICHQTVCNPQRGCEEVALGDFVPCGPVDCSTGFICLSGACEEFETPDGQPCAPATPCSDIGTCQNEECVLPDAGVLVAEVSVPLSEAPAADSAVLSHNGNIFFQSCPASGACRLRSFTGNGFERFSQSFPDDAPRRLLFVGQSVAVASEQTLEAYSPATGALQWSLALSDLQTSRGRVGELPAGAWAVAGTQPSDGGTVLLRLSSSGGVTHQEAVNVPVHKLAIDARGRVLLLSPTGEVASAQEAGDGGFALASLPSVSAGDSLSTSGGIVFAGQDALDADSGVRLYTTVPVSADEEVLWGNDDAFALAFRCTPDGDAGCVESQPELRVHAFIAQDGGALWSSPLWNEESSGVITQSRLVRGGGYLALTRIVSDGGVDTRLQLHAEGHKLFACPLPPAEQLRGAVFEGARMQVLAERSGSWTLESYLLTNIPLDGTGWPTPCGVGGTRRER